MTTSITNDFIELVLEPERSSWSLFGRHVGQPTIEHAGLRVYYRLGRARFQCLQRWSPQDMERQPQRENLHGHQTGFTLTQAADSNGVVCRLHFRVPEDKPYLCWKIEIHNQGNFPIQIDRIELLHDEKRVQGKSPSHLPSRLGGMDKEPAFFSNGWQSWNYTGVYGATDRFRRTHLRFFTEPMRVNAGTPQPRKIGRFASDMFAVLGDRQRRHGILAGFLSQEHHFGSLQTEMDSGSPSLTLWANGDQAQLDPGRTMQTDWAYVQFVDLDHPDPLGFYLSAAARQNDVRLDRTGEMDPLSPRGIPAGWSSWYQYFLNVDASDIRRNLEAAAALRPEIPLPIIQIDDGFIEKVGDWFDFSPGFPDGVDTLAREIEAVGFIPGLWLAPYIVHPGSNLAERHPDWLVRGKFNWPVNAGYSGWDTFTTALDLTHPEALEYTREVIDTAVHKWGFPYLKLDFLYAAALPGRRQDPSRTRAEVLRHGLQAIRETAGNDTILLGCGCPLGPAIGLMDVMRIGADVNPHWQPVIKGIKHVFHHEPDFPSTRNAIQNTLTRAAMHRRWWINDPDCVMVRPDLPMTQPEVNTLASIISLSGGALIDSDDLTALPAERLEILKKLLPPIGARPAVPDWFDEPTPRLMRLDLENSTGTWSLLALFNWSDRSCDLALRRSAFDLDTGSNFLLREFWSGHLYLLDREAVTFPDVPAHGVILVSARRMETKPQPQYLGSSLHISQGLEVTSWQIFRPGNNPDSWPVRVSVCLERPGQAQGDMDLILPGPPRQASLNGAFLPWQELSSSSYRFSLQFLHRAQIEIYL